jgi:hypothetical protein
VRRVTADLEVIDLGLLLGQPPSAASATGQVACGP